MAERTISCVASRCGLRGGCRVFEACGYRDGLHMVDKVRRRASTRGPVPGRVASGFAAGASSEMRDVRNGLRRDATIGFDDDRDDSVALDEERVAVCAALLFNIATARVVVERIIARAAAFRQPSIFMR